MAFVYGHQVGLCTKVSVVPHRITCSIDTRPTESDSPPSLSRRSFLTSLAAATAAIYVPNSPAISGLQEFPLHQQLTNNYWFIRAGESISVAKQEVRTNPVQKTSVLLHGLTRRGINQALLAANKLEEQGVGPLTWVWSSQQQSCQETAELIAYELSIRREQIVPEFAYLDARGVGAMEGKDMRTVAKLLSEIDSTSPDLRMEGGIDGTPNESVADVFVRVRQLMSKLETQYYGENIIIIAPDSDLLSVLECALCNEPLTTHRKFSYAPGELRKITPVIVPRGSPPRLDLFSV